MLKALSPSILTYLIDEAADAVLIMDEHCRVRYVNAATTKLCGYGAGELIGESLNGLLPDSVAVHHDAFVRDYIAGTRTSTVLGRVREMELRHRTGELIPIELKAMDLGTESGTRYFGAIMVDVRHRKTIEASNAALLLQLEHQALTDELTDLPNRRAFDLEASRVMANAKREGWPVTVGIVDIDWFKKVNDRYGHAAGDAALRAVAQFIHQLVRAGDLIGRIGGEEFGLLLPHATTDQALAIVDRIRQKLAHTPVALSTEITVTLTISVGLAKLDSSSSLDAALAQADAALYQAKLTGRNRIVVAQLA